MRRDTSPSTLSILVAVLLGGATLGIRTAAAAMPSPRIVVPLATGWRFHQGEIAGGVAEAAKDDSWQQVTVPHSWSNAEATPGSSFYAGESWYSERLPLRQEWRDRRVFLHFEAVSRVAEVFLNGKRLGEHHGGFAAFAYEITDAVNYDGENRLLVRVDNRRRQDVSPLSGDFTVYGGIYRPVSLIVTGPIDITPLDYASPGIFLKQTDVSPNQASVELTTEVSNGAKASAAVSVTATVLDRAGHRVLSRVATATVMSSETSRVVQNFIVSAPHLWNGVADPYLYTVRVDLSQRGRIVDSSTQPLGLRSSHVDPKLGFVLNGVTSQIHGVCLHQEFDSHGWAATPQDEAVDIRLIREMGANGVRLVHYQHSQSFLDAADREGLLVWAELAQVNAAADTPEYNENIRQQLKELIRQNYNHPSIFVWSLYNELNSPTKAISTPLIADLVKFAHEEDPTRPTTGAASSDTISNLHELAASTDLISDNQYPGWYSMRPEDMGPQIDKWNEAYGFRGLAISEYGAGASVNQHKQGVVSGEVKPNSHFHPEEWQATVHEVTYPAIAQRPVVWGSFLWVMFDFASLTRHEGDTDGINDKGLVTRDRKIRKDAYFFYQASWTTKPMVYITSRRDAIRSQATTNIKVYSNLPQVSLQLNGASLGDGSQVQPHVFVWKDVTLTPGENRVHATASPTVSDDCVWTYTPTATP